MDSVNKTLYIPLYSKSLISKKDLFFKDKKAEEIWDKEKFKLKRKSKSKWLAYYLTMRAYVIDSLAKEKISSDNNIVVIHVGCGLDGRVLRIGSAVNKWYDVDFNSVITERKRYYSENETYHMISADVRNNDWLNSIPERNSALIIMEGVSMYLENTQMTSLINGIISHFFKVSFITDCYTNLGAKLSKYRNPVNEVGVKKVYGIDNPNILENENFVFIKEHEITPTYLINYLSGVKKFIFKKMYAGKLAKKLYKIYEFKSFTNVKSLQN